MSKWQRIEELENALAEANQRAGRLARDNDAHRARERKRMTVEHAEKQARLKAEERAARLKRLEHLGAGLLPLEGATQWTIVHEAGARPGIEVFVPLTGREEDTVRAYLDRAEGGAAVNWGMSELRNLEGVQAHVNRLLASI